MLRKCRFFAVSLSLILLLSSCASSSKTSVTTNAASETGAEDKGYYDGATSTDQSPAEDGSAVIVNPGSISDAQKIIYTVSISLEAEDAAKAIDAIGAEAESIGGYVSGSSYTKSDNTAYGTITLRIPPEKLESFTANLGTYGSVLSSNMGSQDVTAEYTDLESRLKNAQAQEVQLLAIMQQAVKIEDILAVRKELNSVQEEIEVIKGQLRYYDNLVGYSTVTISVTQPTPEPESPEIDENAGLLARWSSSYIWKNIQKGFNNSVNFLVNAGGFMAIALSYILIPAAIVAAIVMVIVFGARWNRRRIASQKKEK